LKKIYYRGHGLPRIFLAKNKFFEMQKENKEMVLLVKYGFQQRSF